MPRFDNVNDYIASFPPEQKKILKTMRQTIKKVAPKAEEGIGYGMPGYKFHGVLVYFAGFKNHYSLFALPKTNIAFKEELKQYKTSKGTIQFSYEKPVPVALITKIVKLRVKENIKKEKLKKAKK